MRASRMLGVLALALVLLAAAASFGQTSKGTISGTVTDSSNAVVVGATIAAHDKLGSETRTATSGPNGGYRIEAVNPSTYQVTITAPHFAKLVLENVEVRASITTPLNAQLAVGGATESVDVEAGALAIQTESAELSKNISTKEIASLPVFSLNAISLVLTQPGIVSVASRDDFTNGASFSVDGLRPRSNNFLIDGFDNNDYGIQGQALQPNNLEAVQELTVETNSYSAEYGRGGGSLTNVIYKGGTNQWHGAAWELYSGAALDALTAEQQRQRLTRVPQFVNNIFGFRLGGPLVKNKLIIFGTSQWNRFVGAEQGSQMVIPTASGLAALQSVTGSPNAQILVNALGTTVAPNADSGSADLGGRPGCPAPCTVALGIFQRTAQDKNPSYEYSVRADFIPHNQDAFYVRYIGTHSSLNPDLFANPNALPGSDTQQGGPARNLGANWTHIFNSRMVNELRFTAQTINFSFDPTAQTVASPFVNLPDVEVSELLGVDFGGLTTGFPQFRDHKIYQYQDAFVWTTGNHSFKFGADITHLKIVDSVPFNSRGSLIFNGGGDCSSIGVATCSGLANFLDDFTGPAGSAGRQFGIPQVSFGQTMQAYYLQDTWKLRSNLTLTYGLRYEYQGTPLNALPFPTVNESGRNSKIFQPAFDPFPLVVREKPDRNNFGPRVGVSYTPKFWTGLFGQDKTVLRAGGGVFYDVLFANILDNAASSTPNVTGNTFVDPNSTGGASRGTPGAFGLLPTTGVLSPLDTVSAVVSNLRNPMTYHWNFNIQRELPGQFVMTAAYVGTRGERLFLNHETNPGVFDPNTFSSTRLNDARGAILVRTNHGDSIYHGLQVDVNRRFRHGLLFRAAYTYAKSIDNGSEVFVTSGGSTRFQDAFSFRGDRGPSAFDRKHRAVFTWVYDTPKLAATNGGLRLLGYMANGWEISGTASFQTGAPETIHVENVDVNGDLSGFNDRPSLGNPKVPVDLKNCFSPSDTCNSGIGFSSDGVSFTDFNSSFDPNFEGTSQDFHYLYVLGKNGNISRNSFYNPGRQDWTLAVGRHIRLPGWERHELEFRAEFFNPFNHADEGVIGVSGNTLDSNFMNAEITRSGGRSIRFWLKYQF